MLDLLNKQRALLLTSEDRWRGLLLKSGVPTLPNNISGPKNLRLGESEPGHPPKLPPLKIGDPIPPAGTRSRRHGNRRS